jgi:hypothetical protein
MGRWLEIFRTLKSGGIVLTPGTHDDTSRKTAGFQAGHVRDTFGHLGGPTSQASTAVNEASQSETGGFPGGVAGVAGVNAIPLKNVLETPNGHDYLANPSSIKALHHTRGIDTDGAELKNSGIGGQTPETPDDTLDSALIVFCDFETRNIGGCDLTNVGVWRYAADLATEIICFGYRVGGVDHSWAPPSHSRDPLEDLAANPDVAFVCFGGFEQVIWLKIMVERHAFAPISTKRWVDLRATCCSLALPRSLDKALTALGLPVKKDKEGQRLVRSLSRPNRTTGAYPELTPAIVERVSEYNRIDIVALEAMRGLGLGRLSAAEQAVWELDQRINARGIAIDVGFVEAAKRIADRQMGEVITEFAQLTGDISPHQVQKTGRG